VAALETALGSLDRAANGRSQTVLLLTDGAPSRGEVRYDSILARVAAKRGRAQMFVFQVGSHNASADLLKDLAQMGGGTVHASDAAGSIVARVGSVMRSKVAPVFTDLRLKASPVELEGFDAALLENMRPGESRTIAVRYRGSGAAKVTVSGVVNGEHLSWSERVQFPRAETGNAFAARFWATERVAAVELNRSRGCVTADVNSTIARLGFRHAIPTPMTSYLVLEPGVKLDANGNVLNAADFGTQGAAAGTGVAAGRGGAAGGGGTPGSGKALALQSVVTTGLADPLETLVGKVAGLQIHGGTLHGSDVVIQMRNPLSTAGYTQPMVIVDGVIQMQDDPALGARTIDGNSLHVAVEDIKTIEVVRGAAAAALYGQRAAYGVINITTIRGLSLPLFQPSSASQDVDVPPASALQRTCGTSQ
jgi:TonB-dependent SusC/RagA subfamily outer membrane receptor